MAAVALPPTPRLRVVPSVEREEAAVPRRAHLQLVTDSFQPQEVSELDVPRFEELAPAHPAVRAQVHRMEEARRTREAQRRREGLAQSAAQETAATEAVRLSDAAALARLLLRVGLVAVFLALVVAVGIIASGLGAPVAGGMAVVQEGQSLWDVAAATGTADVAGTVEDIIELNNLSSSTVISGQQLALPAQ